MATWEVSWTAEEGNFADTFNVYARPLEGVWKLYGSTAGFVYQIEVPAASERFEVGIASVVDGIEVEDDAWEIIVFTPGSLADIPVPPDVSAFTVEQVDQSFDLRARITPVTDNHLEGYEIRQGATWDAAVFRKFVQKGVKGQTVETTFGMLSSNDEVATFLVKAKSVQGQYSAVAASATLTLVDPPMYVAEATTDEHGGGYVGTKTDMEVSGGGLQIEFAPATASAWTDIANTYDWPCGWPHHGIGVYETAAVEADDGAGSGIVVDEVIEVYVEAAAVAPTTMVAAEWAFVIQPDFSDPEQTIAITTGTPGPFARIHADETLVDGIVLKIEINTTLDDPAGTPSWDGWREFIPGAAYRYRGVRLHLTFTAYWWDAIRLTDLWWKRKRLNLKDESLVSVGATGGTAVSFTRPFTKIPVVQATVEANAGLIGTVEPASVSRTGCQVRVYDTSNVEQSSGTVHVTAAGV